MQKVGMIVVIVLLLGISISGCINTSETNNTWGEKKISLNAIKISNNTTGNHSETNQSNYYVHGYIKNENPYEAINPKIKVTTFTINGTEFEVNNTPYLEPKNIPANGESFFYARFSDPENKIVQFEVEIVDAKAEYFT